MFGHLTAQYRNPLVWVGDSSSVNVLPEDGDVIALNVFVRNADSGLLEELLLEFVHLPRGRSKSNP